jgi:hypothetical protein
VLDVKLFLEATRSVCPVAVPLSLGSRVLRLLGTKELDMYTEGIVVATTIKPKA